MDYGVTFKQGSPYHNVPLGMSGMYWSDRRIGIGSTLVRSHVLSVGMLSTARYVPNQ